MANLETAVYTAQTAAADNAGSFIDTAELISGKVSYLQAHWVAPAGTGVGDNVFLAYVPSGMTLIPHLSSVFVNDSNAGVSADLYLGDPDNGGTGVIAEIDISTPGTFLLNSSSSNLCSIKATERTAIAIQISAAVTAADEFCFNFLLVNSN